MDDDNLHGYIDMNSGNSAFEAALDEFLRVISLSFHIFILSDITSYLFQGSATRTRIRWRRKRNWNKDQKS